MTIDDILDTTVANLRKRTGEKLHWQDVARVLAVHLVDLVNAKGETSRKRQVQGLVDLVRLHKLHTENEGRGA